MVNIKKNSIFLIFLFISLDLMTMQEREQEDDTAVLMISQLLERYCTIERKLVAPPCTPEPGNTQDIDDTTIVKESMALCPVEPCRCHYPSFEWLQSHVFKDHKLFLCRCGTCFQELIDYKDHCQKCST